MPLRTTAKYHKRIKKAKKANELFCDALFFALDIICVDFNKNHKPINSNPNFKIIINT